MGRILLVLLTMMGGPAFAKSDLTSVYAKINDKKLCTFTEIKGDESGPESCSYLCDGPSKDIKTKLLSCYDSEGLFLIVKGKSYSTQDSMQKLGGFAGLGNKNGIVEWLKLEDVVVGLIVRFEGSKTDGNGNLLKPKSELAVYDFRNGKVCWKGNFPDNLKAREAFEKSPCKEEIPGQ